MLPAYAELQCVTNFTFLRGASHPEELVQRAAELGYAALAITDVCSVAAVVRAHQAAKECGLKLMIGTQIQLTDLLGGQLILLVRNTRGYSHLCQLISTGRSQAEKGQYRLSLDDLPEDTDDLIAIWTVDAQNLSTPIPGTHTHKQLKPLQEKFPKRLWLGGGLFCSATDGQFIQDLESLSAHSGLPITAVGDVHMHVRARRALQDVLTAIRLGTTVARAGHALFPNGERHLRPLEVLAQHYPAHWLANSLSVADACQFSLDSLCYHYPLDDVPEHEDENSTLKRLVDQGAQAYWPDGLPDKVSQLLTHELSVIAELGYAPYFLTVYDIVRFARERGILCQGRGSAANSAVCYCLGITAVDPAKSDMLFERFISKERNEPPDIDVDFEHERREEVIQYIYNRYGRDRAALAATVITYRRRSAIRDVGKALGIALDRLDALASNMARWDSGLAEERLREVGLDPEDPSIVRLMQLVKDIYGFPRHLSQHVGGFVISREPLHTLVPLENAAMPGRTIIQWDKDDLDALGLLKIDILALGMLTAIRRSFALIAEHTGQQLSLDSIPSEDPQVYQMISRADTVGVFQIESRAQMSMLPRLKPRTFYDLVIQVAIVRPGPIQGDMVHPYLRRRQGLEPVQYPHADVKAVLKRTLGVPLFQEQVIKLAMVAAGFSAGEADGLRRAIAAWRRKGHLHVFRERLLQGMTARGYPQAYAEQIYHQILGFGEYGFPESHAASFALLAYISAWLKHHHPAAFAAALINSQPMGFYAPAQLIQDVRRHGVEVLPVDVCHSQWHCTLEGPKTKPSVRLGLCLIQHLGQGAAQRLLEVRQQQAFSHCEDLIRRSKLDRRQVEALAAADALQSLSGHRHAARWDALATEKPLPLLDGIPIEEPDAPLRSPNEAENLLADYASLGLTLGRHPLALIREQQPQCPAQTARQLASLGNRRRVRYAGLVTTRQHPASAKGTVFLTLEDETGPVNVIVWPHLVERFRLPLLQSQLLEVQGELQQQDGVMHLIAQRLDNRNAWLGNLQARSRDFC